MASRGINKVILVGNLGTDPDIRTTQTGTTIANLSLATSESWKDGQGQKQERTEWHRVVLYGRSAEIARDYLRKGSKLYLEGRLNTRKWQDKQGVDHYTLIDARLINHSIPELREAIDLALGHDPAEARPDPCRLMDRLGDEAQQFFPGKDAISGITVLDAIRFAHYLLMNKTPNP